MQQRRVLFHSTLDSVSQENVNSQFGLVIVLHLIIGATLHVVDVHIVDDVS